MKNYTKGARRRSKRSHQSPREPEQESHADSTARPTPEQIGKGAYQFPRGPGKADRPVHNAASDAIARLHLDGKISNGQEQAARHWQQLRRAYIKELPDVQGYKSCIAGSVPGFDDGDGDPEVIAEYRQMEALLSRAQRVEVLRVCEDDRRPSDLRLLRSALSALCDA